MWACSSASPTAKEDCPKRAPRRSQRPLQVGAHGCPWITALLYESLTVTDCVANGIIFLDRTTSLLYLLSPDSLYFWTSLTTLLIVHATASAEYRTAMRSRNATYAIPSDSTRSDILESVDGLTEVALSTVALCGDLTCGHFLDTTEMSPISGGRKNGQHEIFEASRDDSNEPREKEKRSGGLRLSRGFKHNRSEPTGHQHRQNAYHVMNSRGYFDVVEKDHLTEKDRLEASRNRRYFMNEGGNHSIQQRDAPQSEAEESTASARKTFWPRVSSNSRKSKGRKKKKKNASSPSSDRSNSSSISSRSRNSTKRITKSKSGLRKFLEENKRLEQASFDKEEYREDPPTIDRRHLV